MGGQRFVSLSESEAKELRALQSKCSGQECRRLEGLLMSSKGMDMESIGNALGVQRSTVGKWFDRWSYEGIGGTVNRPKSGRPRRFSPEEEKKLRGPA